MKAPTAASANRNSRCIAGARERARAALSPSRAHAGAGPGRSEGPTRLDGTAPPRDRHRRGAGSRGEQRWPVQLSESASLGELARGWLEHAGIDLALGIGIEAGHATLGRTGFEGRRLSPEDAGKAARARTRGVTGPRVPTPVATVTAMGAGRARERLPILPRAQARAREGSRHLRPDAANRSTTASNGI